ncbi:MAG: hypothetical protein WDZ76_01720 [Pseudohongiellaceae bacterium]
MDSFIDSYVSADALDNAIAGIRQSPSDEGVLELIVCRPGVGQRTVLSTAQLTVDEGLVGDNWKARGLKHGEANPAMQINIMNARSAAAVAGDRSRWPLAGDQFYVDFDLSDDNLPPGTQVQIGHAVLEITAEPHLGCRKFAERFGKDAVMFVNSDVGKALNLRGINAKVIVPGAVAVGDTIKKRSE